MLHDIWFEVLKTLFFGCVGMVIENIFTGCHSIIFLKDKNAMCRTSLWSILIYGVSARILGLMRWIIPWKIVFVVTAVIFIFVAEYCSGWLLRRIGVKAWDYTNARWGIHGLIRLDYLPFWMMAAIGFDLLTDIVDRVFQFVGSLG